MKDFLTTPLLVGLMDQDCQIKIKIYFGLNIGSWLYGLTQRNCALKMQLFMIKYAVGLYMNITHQIFACNQWPIFIF